MKSKLILLAAALCASPVFAATPTTTWDANLGLWVTSIDGAGHVGSSGTITFNDWGYKGPTVTTNGVDYTVGANDFKVGAEFNPGSIGQRQHVITKLPDYLTSDPASNVVGDLGDTSVFNNANMDGAVNFYKWGYTTPADSTFNNMQIDTAGNYHIAKTDMSFRKYDSFVYRNMSDPKQSQSYDTRINFKPYTVSDAKGWCGSVLTPNPGGLAQMAGQVTFDLAMDIYFDFNLPSGDIYSSTELVRGFVMRSYGDYTVDIWNGAEQQYFQGSAVGNNTNPTSIVAGVGGTLDPEYQNDVSFLGAGVLSAGEWVSADSFNANGTKKMRTDVNATTGETTQVWDVTIVDAGTPGAVWHSNVYGGKAFILRADGMRILDYVSPTGHSDYVATIPEPETYAMMLAGVALVGFAARRRRAV